jgi:hypothetical protein
MTPDQLDGLTLADLLTILYPGYSWPSYSVSIDPDDPNGQIITGWNIPDTLQPTEADLIAAAPGAVNTRALRQLQAQATQALKDSNQLIFTFLEQASDAVPQAWKDYRASLRSILAQTQGDVNQTLPAQPS